MDGTLNQLRIATWNLARPRPGDHRRTVALTEHMRAIDADIWVLTEAHSQVPPSSDHRLLARSDRADAKDPNESWVTIWSRVGGEPLLTSDIDRTAAIELALNEERSLVVFGTVLPWLGSAWRGTPAADGAAFQASLAHQASDWRRIQSGKCGRELCVAGDFNQDLLGSGHYYGSKAGRNALRSALAEAKLSCSTSSSMLDLVQRHAGDGTAGVDHICVSSGLLVETEEAKVWPDPTLRGAGQSDHFGIAIDVAAS